jgi:bzd-type benzoyl-CoA reductase Q subunit
MAMEFWRWPESRWTNPDIDWRKGKIITAGVDVGSVSSQAVIMVDGEVYAYSNIRTGSDSPDSAWRAMNRALEGNGMKVEDIHYCIGTGYGRVNVPMAQRTITEIACHARGANFMYGPSVRTVLDMGGQDCKAIRCDERGKVLKFIMNDKCAAGTGRGMEVFADLINVPIQDVGPRSLDITKEPPMITSTCVIFAKTEVQGLMEEGWPDNDIMASYCTAMAHRICDLLKRLGIEERFAITGGIAKNPGVVKRMEEEMGIKTMETPMDTQIAGGIGAALFGKALIEKGRA